MEIDVEPSMPIKKNLSRLKRVPKLPFGTFIFKSVNGDRI